jgi:sensor histidine kinase YesM
VADRIFDVASATIELCVSIISVLSLVKGCEIDMEEERERRRLWWKEQGKLSPEEREKRDEEYAKRAFEHYLKLTPEVLLAEAQVHSTFNSILAGLTFTASVLFFTFGRSLANGELMAFLTLLDTFLFIASALVLDFHSSAVRRGEMWEAYHYHSLSQQFGWAGGLLMMANLVAMTFFLGLVFGVAMLVIIALSLSYIFYRMFRDVLKFYLFH